MFGETKLAAFRCEARLIRRRLCGAKHRHRSQVRILSAVPRRRKLCIACDDIFMLCIKMSSCAHTAATPSKIATTMLGCNFAVWDADFLTCLEGIKLAAFRCEARLIRRRLCGAQRRHRSQVRILSGVLPPPVGRRDVTFITDLLSLTGRAAFDIVWPTSHLASEPAEDFGAAPAADGPEAGSRPGHAL